MLYQIKSYVKFLLRSTNQHGVHSPFIYDLITKCFYDKSNFQEYEILKKHRKELLQSQESIEITDFGAGSRVFKSNRRKVSAIAKNAGITLKRQHLLFRLSRYLKADSMLEMGTSLGLGTVAMSLGNPLGRIATVEGCPLTAEKALTYFNKFQLKNIEMHSKTFESFFSESMSGNYELVYIDGNHLKEKTIEYFVHLLKYMNNDSVLIFDDIYWSWEMTEAWQQIIAHPRVTVSIDTFQWGLVFFRKEQTGQHFTVRL